MNLYESVKNNLKEAEDLQDVYYFMVGICLDENRPDADKDEFFDYPQFKIPYKLMDENYGCTQTADEAIRYAESYVKDGVPGTFGVVTVAKEPYAGFKEEISGGFNDGMDFSDIKEGKVIFCAYSTKDDIEYVVNGTMNEAEEKKKNGKPKKKYTMDDFDTLEDALNELKKVKGVDNYFTKEEWDAIDPDDINTCNYYIKDIIDNYLNESSMNEAEGGKLIKFSEHLKDLANELENIAEMYDEDVYNGEGDVFEGTEDEYASEMLDTNIGEVVWNDVLLKKLDDDIKINIASDLYSSIRGGYGVTYESLIKLLDKYGALKAWGINTKKGGE